MRVLYVAYWGGLEPLGQALLLPTAVGLAREGTDVTLVTFEKPADLHRNGAAGALSQSLREAAVSWEPLAYHKRPRIPATLFDVLNGWQRGVRAARRSGAQIVVGRTFIGGLIARTVAATLGLPFVYHAEGFYPDEMVDGGFWARASTPHRAAKRLDESLFRTADGVIVLSHRAREALLSGCLSGFTTPVLVVPSAIDLDRFTPCEREPLAGREVRLVHLGGVGGRYKLDTAARLARALLDRRPARLDVLTRDAEAARRILSAELPEGAWSVRTVPHRAVPAELRLYDAGCAFLVEGLSEHGGSPTKVGEYWASGMPVVTTARVGDVGDIVGRERVGVILREDSDAGHREAAGELLALLDEPDLTARCRCAAETHYSIAVAARDQLKLLLRLAGQ